MNTLELIIKCIIIMITINKMKILFNLSYYDFDSVYNYISGDSNDIMINITTIIISASDINVIIIIITIILILKIVFLYLKLTYLT